MQHLMHISLQNGFNFLVHPSAFVVHVPHPKPSTKWLTRKMGQVRWARTGGGGLAAAVSGIAAASHEKVSCSAWLLAPAGAAMSASSAAFAHAHAANRLDALLMPTYLLLASERTLSPAAPPALPSSCLPVAEGEEPHPV